MILRYLPLLLVLALAPGRASARATFKVQTQGDGFDDATPAAPVGGNPGKTLGEQRRLALSHALDLWAGQLDSTVPIALDVQFADLGCGQDGAVILGQAGAVSYEAGLDAPRANPALVYPSALANSLAGRDLDESTPDIRMQLNAAADDSCRSRTRGFYYGFDGEAGDANDLVDIVLHELAHGLGFSSTVDLASGALQFSVIDAFSAQLFDLDSGRPWSQLTAAQRAQSAGRPRRLVWNGPEAKRAAQRELTLPQPRLQITPAVADLSGLISDTSIGMPAPQLGTGGPLALGQGCAVEAPAAAVSDGWVALFTRCDPVVAAKAAQSAGAVAALLVRDSPYDLPPLPLETTEQIEPIALPLLTLAANDARAIQLAMSRGTLNAQLSSDMTQHLGTDSEGRPLMFASNPVNGGSSVSHVEPVLRPNQLMEPLATPRPKHNLVLTRAFLQDIGWSSLCGDGHVDPTEECDEGEGNDDHKPQACRSDCRKAHCGDGVKDEAEACDDGAANDDQRPNACRTNCQRSHCGDGVTDDKEQCDKGPNNDDGARDACRTSCRNAYCGDGVVDALEQCDDGAQNDDHRADACRSDCRRARCGDGVVDRPEACDAGSNNGKPAAHGCRNDCSLARCGDGIVDDGEACDGSADCSDLCELSVPEPPQKDPTTSTPTSMSALQAEPRDSGVDAAAAVPQAPAHASGCGCRVAGPTTSAAHSALFLAAASVALLRWRRRRTRRPCSSARVGHQREGAARPARARLGCPSQKTMRGDRARSGDHRRRAKTPDLRQPS